MTLTGFNFVIPLGGKGERFTKSGYMTPKPLISIIDKAMILYVLDGLIKYISDKDRVIIIYDEHFIPSLPLLISQQYSQIISNQFTFVTLSGKKTRGAVETILEAEDHLLSHKPTFVIDCDTFYTCWDDIIVQITTSHSLKKSAVFYFDEPEPFINPAPYSYIEFDKETSIISDIVEKNRISSYANTGAYFFTNTREFIKYCKKVVNEDKRFKNEFYTSVVIKEMLSISNSTFLAVKLPYSQVISLGTPEQVKSYVDKTYACLFDLDGTLVNSDHIYFKVWQKILESVHLELTPELYDKFIKGNSDTFVSNSLSLNMDSEVLSKMKDDLFIELIEQVNEVPKSFDYLKSCYQSGHKVCIVTNCNRRVAEHVLMHYDSLRYIDHLVIGSECTRPKPYPDPYDTALKLLNMEKSRAIIFEDSPSGLKSAEAAMPLAIIHIGGPQFTDFTTVPDVEYIVENNVTINTSNLTDKDKLEQSISDIFKVSKHDVTINTSKLKGGFIADVVQFHIKKEKSYIAKLKSRDQSNKLYEMAENLDLYNREAYFYETISPHVKVFCPKFFGNLRDDTKKSLGIVLEDLNKPWLKLNLNLNQEKVDTSLKVIESMAVMHADFWNVTEPFTYLKRHNEKSFSWPKFVKERWSTFKEKWSTILNKRQLNIAETIANSFEKIENELSQDPLTLCHGDIKSPNTFYDTRYSPPQPWFLDWQYVSKGKGVQDLVFFLIESFSAENAIRFDKLFSEYYYVKLTENLTTYNKTTHYSKEEFDIDKKNAICYFPFFVAIWFGTTAKEDLIDVNFPFFYITKYFAYLEYLNIHTHS